MPIAHVASARTPGTYPGVSSNTDTITIAKPSGTVDGHFMLAFTAIGATHTLTQPGGWTLVDSFDTGAGGFRVLVWSKVASGEGTNYTWTSSSNTVPCTGIISTFSGVDTSAPVHAYDKNGGVASTNPVTTPTVSTTERCRMVQSIFYRCTGVTQGTITDPASHTQLNGTGNRGGAIQFYGDVWMANAEVNPGSQAGVAGTGSQGTIEANNRWALALREYVAPVAPDAGKGAVTTTAYGTENAVGVDTGKADVTTTAYNAVALTGIEAANVPQGAVTVAAYNPTVVFTGLAEAGASAYNATVGIGVDTGKADVTASALNSVGYFGAPRERKFSIPKEDRTLRARRGKSDRG